MMNYNDAGVFAGKVIHLSVLFYKYCARNQRSDCI